MVRPIGSKNLTDEQVAVIIDAKVQGKTHPESLQRSVLACR
jgi:hypothetical protein